MGTTISMIIVSIIVIANVYKKLKERSRRAFDPQGELIRETQIMLNDLYQLDVDKLFNLDKIQDDFRRDASNDDLEALEKHHANATKLLILIELD